ncbi:hypothetical protein [Microcystis phage Mwe-JY26]
MPVLFQHRIYRVDLKNNPTVLYLFGDNALRVGLGGQAKEMRGEKNAIGIATKWRPSMEEEAFFSDKDYTAATRIMRSDMDTALEYARKGGVVVIPSDGLGTGLSQLPERAPRIYAFLEGMLDGLKRL